MKKFYLFLVVVLMASMSLSAQVAFLQRVDDAETGYPAENYNTIDQQPEKNAYDWFNNTYSASDKHVLTLQQVKDGGLLTAGAPAFKALWVNIDAVGLANLADAGIDNDVINAIKAYVKAGGNVLLTKQATRLALDIERISLTQDLTWPTTTMESYNNSGTLAIQPLLGSNLSDEKKRDARQHPIYAGMENYDLVSGVGVNISGYNNDANYFWKELRRTNGTKSDNGDIANLNNFQSDWACSVLALQGNIGDFCLPVIIEFHPQGDYKGSVIAIGSAAYQWNTSNTNKGKVETLTSNALNYLAAGGDEYGYYLPYSLSEIYSIDQYQPEYQPAKWFYDNYVVPGNGRFIHKDEVFPTGMKVLWVHGDRVGQNTVDFYNAFGGDAFKTKLQAFVQAGGKVFLTKQANRFANDIGRCSWAPSYVQSGYGDGSDTWYMVSNFVAVGSGVDRHNHPAFRYMEDYTVHTTEGYCKWPLVNGDGTYKRSDHKYMWGEPGSVWNDTYGISAGVTDIARLNAFESAQNCQILGGWGHTTALDGVTMVEFLPTASFAGTVIAQGVPAYQWTTPNTAIDNVKNLTQGVLEYLNSADIYTRDVPANHYGTICLPRASASLSAGMTVYRVLSDHTDGIMLEEVNAMEAGVPYFFYSTANRISVTMTGAAVLAPQNGNGLVGNFGPASVEIPNETDNYILGSDNTLYYIDQAGIMLGANRAYLDRSTINQSTPSGMPKRVMGIHKAPSVTTALDNTGSQNILPVKKLINGRLVIQVGDQLYDVTGTQVK